MLLPKLSVLIPNYNHAKFLPEAIESILAQSYRPDEVIILDDCSTDNSLDIIQNYAKMDPIVRLERNHKNMGVVYSVNKLLKVSKYEYVFCPSADDIVLPGFFEESIKILSKYPQAGLCSSVSRMMDRYGVDKGIRAIPVISKKPAYYTSKEVSDLLDKYGRWIVSGTVIFKKDAWDEFGGQIEELGSFADTFLNLLIALKCGVCYVPKPGTSWRQMGTGYAVSSNLDWNELKKKGDLTVDLMLNEYKHLFPKKYVQNFKKHWGYQVKVATLARFSKKSKEAITRCAEKGYSLKFFQKLKGPRIISFLINVLTIIVRLYLMVRFGTWGWWIRGRFSIMRNLGKLTLRDKFDL